MNNPGMILSILLGSIFLSATASLEAWAQAKPTIEEPLIRLEEGQINLEKRLDAVEASLNKRIDDLRTDLNARIDELRSLLLTGFGVLFAGMFALIGFVIWDRRTAIAPVVRETKELTAREEKILTVLRDYAKEDARLSEIMKRLGLW